MRTYGDRLVFCYEAGPCGYEIYRWIKECVVAPSLIPRKPGQRVKTDRRDAGNLAEFLRNGDLTAVWVPDEEQEAIRDLTRAREDMKKIERQLKQKLSAFLLRHDKKYGEGKSKWTQRYYRWLSEVKLESPVEQIAFEEYVDAVKQTEMRVASMEEEMRNALTIWSLSPVVKSLMALRGVNMLTSNNWKGIPLNSYETILKYMRRTKTTPKKGPGLKVKATLVRKRYISGQKISDEQMSQIQLKQHDAFPFLNYSLSPKM